MKVRKFWSTALVRKKIVWLKLQICFNRGLIHETKLFKIYSTNLLCHFYLLLPLTVGYQLSVSLACWQSTKVFSKTDNLIHSYYLKPLSFKGEPADILIKTLIRSCWWIMTLLLMNALHWTIFWKATPISVRRTLNSSYRLLVC